MANGFVGQVHIGDNDYLVGSTLFTILDTSVSPAQGSITTKSGTTNTKLFSVPLVDFALVKGVTVHVQFKQAWMGENDITKLELKVGDTLSYEIVNPNGALTWNADSVISFTLAGTGTNNYKWVMNSSQVTGSSFGDINFGNIQSNGTLQPGSNSDVTIAVGDKLVITDANDNYKVARASLEFTSAVSSQTQSTQFLRSDGTWAAPSYTTDTHYTANLIVGSANDSKSNSAVNATTNSLYLNLIENNIVRNYHQIVGATGITVSSDVYGKITITGSGGTVTSITPGNGLINGTTGSSQTPITGTGTISIKEGGVTNTMLANNTITIAEQEIALGGSLTTATLLAALGIGDAVHYVGTSSSTITDGGTETPTITNLPNYTPEAGDIVLYDGKEFIWTAAGAWELFGDEGSYALKSNTVTNIAWDSTNKKLTKTINNSTTDVVTISTIKTALDLGKSDVGLNNVTNHQQVHEVAWDATNKKITRSKNGTAGDVVTFAEGTNVTLTGASGQLTIAAADPTVTQNILATTIEDLYPLLVSAYKKDTTTTTATTVNRIQAIYVQPSTGTVYATKFHGNGSELTDLSTSAVQAALGGFNSNTTNTTLNFLHQSGNWKTLSLKFTQDNTNGNVITNVTHNGGSFPTLSGGTATTASVSGGVLTITLGSDASLNGGNFGTVTLTKSKVEIQAANVS